MKALVLTGPNTPFVLESRPDPTPEAGEAVARVFACGAGLTIQHVKAGRAKAQFPRIIGHEICGEIVEVGPGVTNPKVGDRVTAYFYLNCGHCRWCLTNREPLCTALAGNIGREVDGGYAEYIKLPSTNFLVLPDGLDVNRDAAEIGVICDAIATPFKVLRRAQIAAGETVAVFGAGGGVGIHMVMMARWARARVIAIDIASEKLQACREAGADEVVDASQDNVSEALLAMTEGRGVDAAVDFVSQRATLEAGVAALQRGGRLVTLGGAGESFSASSRMMLAKELDLLGSRYVTRSDVAASLDVVARGEVWPLVSEKVPLAQAEGLHDRIERGLVTGRAAVMLS